MFLEFVITVMFGSGEMYEAVWYNDVKRGTFTVCRYPHILCTISIVDSAIRIPLYDS